VAIVGAGPSGLAVAYDLVQMGYRATIYEREEHPGGLLVTGVPLYRLDREVVANEIGDLVEMGVEIKTGVEVGRDVTLQELRDTHDAVVVAAGYSGGRVLPLPGADAHGVLSALDFLRHYCLGLDCAVGPRVVVVGGGDVGCDCSRSALRCGASESYQIIRETMEEMPAQDLEARGALEEGVVFKERWNPVEVLTKATPKRRGKAKAVAGADPPADPPPAADANPAGAADAPAASHVVGMRFQRIIELFDEEGRLRAEPILVDEFMEVACDTVIFAIGQGLQLGFLEGSGVAMDNRGRPLVDLATGASSVPGLFFAGDVASGPKTIIIAIGQAHETAISVHRYLQHQDLTADRRPPVHPPQYYLQKVYAPSPDEVIGDGGPGGRRVAMPESEPETRVALGAQVELGWPKGDGHREAIRCMRCQTHVCVACTMCARVCPDNCIAVEGDDTGYKRTVARYDFVMEWCCFCGLCQDICPTQTLSLAADCDYARTSRRAFFYDRRAMLRPFDGPQVLENKDGLP
jgi:NADPH-dependent glutamate synthase beta subunit-like oxidoreductase/Pyruvate/2-oxoacid:ferredoxin oxidoreductase delta subunit